MLKIFPHALHVMANAELQRAEQFKSVVQFETQLAQVS